MRMKKVDIEMGRTSNMPFKKTGMAPVGAEWNR